MGKIGKLVCMNFFLITTKSIGVQIPDFSKQILFFSIILFL